jgi:hypothetical protein
MPRQCGIWPDRRDCRCQFGHLRLIVLATSRSYVNDIAHIIIYRQPSAFSFFHSEPGTDQSGKEKSRPGFYAECKSLGLPSWVEKGRCSFSIRRREKENGSRWRYRKWRNPSQREIKYAALTHTLHARFCVHFQNCTDQGFPNPAYRTPAQR